MDSYAVIIRADISPALTERQLNAIAHEAGGTIAYDSGTSVLRYTGSADNQDGIAALGKADGKLARAVYKHAGAVYATREARVLDWDEFEAETFRPRDDLAGAAEACEILGVKRQQLAEVRKNHADFPAPIKDLKATPVWDRAELEAWGRGWERKRTGRPRKAE